MASEYFHDQMQSLRSSYEDRLPQLINQINSHWEKYLESGDTANADMAELRFKIHKLAGSAATYGFSGVGDIAYRIELLLQILVDSGLAPSQSQIEQIRAQIFALKTSRFVSKSGSVKILGEDALPSRDTKRLVVTDKLLYILDDDEDFAKRLSLELCGAGFKPHVFLSSAAFEQAVENMRPDVVLMDMRLQEGNYAGAEITSRINTGDNKPVPVIFMSVNDGFQSRLEAVRAGATHYFKKPFEINIISQVLSDVTLSNPASPYRVLIIDDDHDLTNVYRLALESAGIVSAVENDPLKALAAIKGFDPDLILVDVHMPNCNGIELATIIRQYHQYDMIPIVFLSTEWRMDTKLASINLGSDDFLSKPIASWFLVETLRTRIKRARILRAGTEKIKKF